MSLSVSFENCSLFKTIINILGGILDEIPIEIKDNKLLISTTDETQTILITIKLGTFKEITHDCNFIFGILLSNLIKTLKYVDKKQSVKMVIKNDDINTLIIKQSEKSFYKLKLIDTEKKIYDTKKINFDVVIVITQENFLLLCQELNQSGDRVEIICNKNGIKFIAKGNGIEFEKELSDKEVFIKFYEEEKILSATYEINNICLFTKCTSFCENVELYMQNNGPLGIKYVFNKNDKISLFISRMNDEVEKFNEDNYSDNDEIKFKDF